MRGAFVLAQEQPSAADFQSGERWASRVRGVCSGCWELAPVHFPTRTGAPLIKRPPSIGAVPSSAGDGPCHRCPHTPGLAAPLVRAIYTILAVRSGFLVRGKTATQHAPSEREPQWQHRAFVSRSRSHAIAHRPRDYIWLVRRSLTTRVTALLLAFLGSLSAPGAALTHGAAHHRESHGEQHHAVARHAHEHEAHHGHHHTPAPPVDAVEVRTAGTAKAPPALPMVAASDEPDGSHDHPTLDRPVRPRVELAAILPLITVAVLLDLPEIDVATGTPVPHAALARPDPDAAPPPRTRAPPLR